MLGLSVDPVGSHRQWAEEIEETQGYALDFPRTSVAGVMARPQRDRPPFHRFHSDGAVTLEEAIREPSTPKSPA